MPDSRTQPEHQSGEQRFRADLVTYLDSLPVGELAGLLCELPVMTRVTLVHELSDRGPSWARLPVTWPQHPDVHLMLRRSLREVLVDRHAARTTRRHRRPIPAAPAGSSSRFPAAAAPVRSPSGGWPRRCAAQPRPGLCG